nr:MAG TPA: hypothetical protein [Caudoviricetes sp.]
MSGRSFCTSTLLICKYNCFHYILPFSVYQRLYTKV